MNNIGEVLLVVGALRNFAIALLHLITIVIGPPAYLYFGAVGLAQMADQGSLAQAIMTLCLAAVFGGFGVYARSGAGIVGRLPLVKLGLIVVGGLDLLRGFIVVLDVLRLMRGDGYPLRQTVFSAGALGIGVVYLVGTATEREHVSNRSRPGAPKSTG